MTQYYNTLNQELAAYPKPSLPVQTESLERYEVWARKARAKLWELLGLDRMRPCAPDAQKLEEKQLDGYRREKWIVQTEPGIYVSLYLLIPDGLKPRERRPVVMCPHGHTGAKDSTSGTVSIPEMEDNISIHRYDYGRKAAQMGFVAVCMDARGHGERREPDQWGESAQKRLHGSCAWLNHMAIPLGRCVAGMWTWDLMRLADWLLTLDYVCGNHLATMGLSGGGLQSLYFSALDERVCYTVISGYFYGFKEALLELHNCSCNYVPHLWEYFDIGEIGSLIAPRPLVIETGDEDPLNGRSGLNNVIPYVDQVRKVFALYGREDDIYHDIFHGPHRWNGKASMERLEKYMKV